ncbi:MAG: CGNR zinc finger domain-containing protein [Pseudomonadota bacterium]
MNQSETPFRLVGGRLALDFVNTTDWSSDGEAVLDKLATIGDVRRWTEAAGLGPAVGAKLSHDLPALLDFRLQLRNVLLAAMDGSAPSPGALARLNEALASGGGLRMAGKRLLPAGSLRWLVSVSAMALFGEPRDMARLRMCPGHDCGWLFVDESRNGRRRWCTMATCGNREKARRHYAGRKIKEDEGGAPPRDLKTGRART